MLATRAMQSMALISYMLGLVLSLFFTCAAETMVQPAFASKSRVLEIFTIIGSKFIQIDLSLAVATKDQNHSKCYVFVFALPCIMNSLMHECIGLLIVFNQYT